MRAPKARPARRRLPLLPLLAIPALVLLGVLVSNSRAAHWLQTRVGGDKPGVFTVKPVNFAPSIQVQGLYPPHDKWADVLPNPEACPGSTEASLSSVAAEQAMVCVLNYARVRAGLTALPVSPVLHRSAELKALDIIRCQDFSHFACGKNPRAVADEAGYPQVNWGENLYLGPGPFRPARLAADGWLNSPGHRENLRRNWTEQGAAVVTAKEFQGQKNVAIWVSEFGAR
jgi:uncharacterized protein YkwD